MLAARVSMPLPALASIRLPLNSADNLLVLLSLPMVSVATVPVLLLVIVPLPEIETIDWP